MQNSLVVLLKCTSLVAQMHLLSACNFELKYLSSLSKIQIFFEDKKSCQGITLSNGLNLIAQLQEKNSKI